MEKFVTKKEFQIGTATLLQDIGMTKGDVVSLRLDLSELKTDFRDFKENFEDLDILGKFDGLAGAVETLRQEQIFTNQALKRLEKGQTGLSRDVNGLKQDVGGLKQDFGTIKQDVGGLKQDFGTIKQDVDILKQNVDKILVILQNK